MLNLYRSPGEGFVIDHRFTVTVLEVFPRTVRVRIESPEFNAVVSINKGPAFQLAENVALFVRVINGQSATIGIAAPPHMPIIRTECLSMVLA